MSNDSQHLKNLMDRSRELRLAYQNGEITDEERMAEHRKLLYRPSAGERLWAFLKGKNTSD